MIEPVPISLTRTALRCVRCGGFLGYWEDNKSISNNKITEKKTRIRPFYVGWSIDQARKMI